MGKKHSKRTSEDSSLDNDGDFTSDFFIKKNGLKFKKRGFKFSEKQQKLISILENDFTNVVFIEGPAGSSKTYLSVYSALRMAEESWKDDDFDNHKEIIYIRSIIESGSRNLGSLPGSADEKFAPFKMPLEDKVIELLQPSDALILNQSDLLTAIPVNFVRGASWDNKIVIIDEAQNMDLKEITTILTRIGKNTKVFFCGDPMQSDIRDSGFQTVLDSFSCPESSANGIFTFKFEDYEIFRSEILKFIVNKLQKIKK